jgi:dephospho-CoA kinase
MIIIGLTGSIGMGKSTAATMLRRMGVAVSDADATVHRLLAAGGAAVAPVDAAFPGVVRDGAVDRALLGQRVFGDRDALRRLEKIIHPLVGRERDRFLRRAAVRRLRLVAFDVPLLYETGGERRCDAVVLVSAPAFIQSALVLRRPGMTSTRLEKIRAQQWPDGAKRRRAQFVVETGLGLRTTLQGLAVIVKLLRRRMPRHWPPARQPRWKAHRNYARNRSRY